MTIRFKNLGGHGPFGPPLATPMFGDSSFMSILTLTLTFCFIWLIACVCYYVLRTFSVLL